MKTIYCLGRTPQFKLPCVKYNYLLKEKEYKTNNFLTLPKNEIDFNEYEIEDVKNMNDDERKEIVNQMLDKIYPKRGLKRCLQINNINKIKIRKFLKGLNISLADKKNTKNIKNNEKNSVNKKIEEKCKSTQSNDSQFNQILSESNSEYKNNKKNNNIQYLSEPSRNKFGNLSHKYFNYNYPISHEENNEYFSKFLNKKYLNTKENIISNSIDAYKSKNNKNLKITNSTLNTYYHSNKKRSIGIQLTSTNTKTEKNIFQKKYLANIFGDSIEKLKRKKGETQDNELNIIYSETKEQFYIKYDKYRKNENLKGLGLANINYPPKIKFKELNKKIGEIKKKVINVRTIVDSTFPKVLAYLTWSKKEYENSLKKKGFNTPYKERLNMMRKHQKYINLYLSSPIEIISRNSNKNHL